MSERAYCRFVLLYLIWLAILAFFGLSPPRGSEADAFLWRAHMALYPTVICWIVMAITRGAFRGR